MPIRSVSAVHRAGIFPRCFCSECVGVLSSYGCSSALPKFPFCSAYFFVYTYSVCFFGRMLASLYFAALVFRTKFFFCTSWGLLSSVSAKAVLTLFNFYLLIIKKQCWLPDAHLLFSMKMVLCFVVVLL